MSTAGPNICGTGADQTGVGSVTWQNPTNIQADDSNYATANVNHVSFSHWLKATNFGFSIPAGSTINGIQFTWKLKSDDGNAQVIGVKSVKGGVIGGNDLFDGAFISAVEGNMTYGGVSQLWGQSWSYSDINASTFGCVFQVAGDPTNSTISVNSVTATITYTPATGHKNLLLLGVG